MKDVSQLAAVAGHIALCLKSLQQRENGGVGPAAPVAAQDSIHVSYCAWPIFPKHSQHLQLRFTNGRPIRRHKTSLPPGWSTSDCDDPPSLNFLDRRLPPTHCS